MENRGMKLPRFDENNKLISVELTHSEMWNVYCEMQFRLDCDWIRSLLEDYGYDNDRISEDTVQDLAQVYRKKLEGGDALGECEHTAFELAVESFDLPEVE